MRKTNDGSQKTSNKIDGLTIALIITAGILFLFIVSIEVMYYILGSVPDSLVQGVLGCGGAECASCVLVYFVKKKFKIREDQE